MKDYNKKPDCYGIDSDQMSEAICRAINEPRASVYKELETALYTVRTYAQNEFNADYWRVLWSALEYVTPILEGYIEEV